uniref:Uncharacterized protein n=1 Tax=Anopheles christyi TaxID=43041 RepID=A0A182KFG2_9DIPT
VAGSSHQHHHQNQQFNPTQTHFNQQTTGTPKSGTSPSCSSTPPPAFDDISEHGSSSHRHSSDDKTGSSSGIGSAGASGIGGGGIGDGIGGGGGGSVDRRSTSCRSDNYKEDSI